MNNNLPIEIKPNNMFRKFFNYIKKILFNKKQYALEKEYKVDSVEEEKNSAVFNENYRVNIVKQEEIINKYNNKRKIEEIIAIIEEFPQMLKKLNKPQLLMIEQYYKDKIEEYKKKLN